MNLQSLLEEQRNVKKAAKEAAKKENETSQRIENEIFKFLNQNFPIPEEYKWRFNEYEDFWVESYYGNLILRLNVINDLPFLKVEGDLEEDKEIPFSVVMALQNQWIYFNQE